MPTISRPRLMSLAAGLAVAVLATGFSTPAQADDHPDIFTFEAHRTTGNLVTYSGRFAVWDDDAQEYKSAADGDNHLVLDQYIPQYQKVEGSAWDEFYDVVAESDGSFSGTLHVYPAATLRASVDVWSPANLTFSKGASTASVTLAYEGAMPVGLYKDQAYQAKPKGAISINGEVAPSCIVVSATGSQIYCPMTEKVYLQTKIKGKWTNVHTFKNLAPNDGALGVVTIKHPKGTLYRYYLPGSHTYVSAHTPTFKGSPHRSLN